MNPSPQIIVLEIIDYFVQAVLFALGFVYPWFVPRGRGWRLFIYPLIIAFFWGIWRVVLFDPATHNDIPGIGYWFMGFMLALIASGFYGLRRFFTRSTPAPNDTKLG